MGILNHYSLMFDSEVKREKLTAGEVFKLFALTGARINAVIRVYFPRPGIIEMLMVV
jgi:hypothetical protein